jgi:hypothetical protein
MTNPFSLHVDIFKHWLDNFDIVSFDVEDEDMNETKTLLIKLTNNQNIDEKEIELLYTLSMDNATMQKNDFIKFQAKTIVNFLNADILTNINKESL